MILRWHPRLSDIASNILREYRLLRLFSLEVLIVRSSRVRAKNGTSPF